MHRATSPALLVIILMLVPVTTVSGQEPGPGPGDSPARPADPTTAPAPTTESLEGLVETLEDPVRRESLLRDLRTLLEVRKAQEPAAEKSLLDDLTRFFGSLSTEVRQTTAELLTQLGALPASSRAFAERLLDPDFRSEFLTQGGLVVGILLMALGGLLLAWWLLRGPRRFLATAERVRPPAGEAPATGAEGPDAGEEAGHLARIARSLGVLVLETVPPAAFLLLSMGGITVLGPSPVARTVTLAIAWAVAIRRIVVLLPRVFLAPGQPGIRLVPLTDTTASRLDHWIRRLATLGVYGYFFLVVASALGASPELVAPLRKLYGFILLAVGVSFVLRHRGQVKAYLGARSSRESETSRGWTTLLLSSLHLWWVVAILYMVGLFVVWAGGVREAFAVVVRATLLTVLAVAGGLVAASLLRLLVRRTLAATRGWQERYPELKESIPRYDSGLRTVVNVLVLVFVLCLILEAWGVGALALLTSDSAQSAMTALFSILLIVLAAAAIVDFATVATQRYLESQEKRGRASAKARTMLPLARKAIKLIVIVLATIMALSQAGVQIAPLLAGVGVLGLAVGFGAQTLVKDIITGVFILMEDTVSVGDIAMVNGTGGQVEAISIRTLRLRDVSGNVHTIPYSSITTVTNMTKDFSRYLIEAGVAYREDTDEVVKILQEVGAQMRQDADYRHDILEPIEIMGVDRFENSAVIVRARLKTRPMQQWRVGREFNRRMKKAFDARGIEIPFPHRTLYWGQLKDGTAPPLPLRSDGPARRGAGDGASKPEDTVAGRREG
ncbi:MAG: mechanosensitive ion channel [Planctomycetes bacterium]|nr:mechanosensitive ion channel [Planctomycetota bacterium]